MSVSWSTHLDPLVDALVLLLQLVQSRLKFLDFPLFLLQLFLLLFPLGLLLLHLAVVFLALLLLDVAFFAFDIRQFRFLFLESVDFLVQLVTPTFPISLSSSSRYQSFIISFWSEHLFVQNAPVAEVAHAVFLDAVLRAFPANGLAALATCEPHQ